MKNAANKARADVEAILCEESYQEIPIVIPYKGKQPLMTSLKEHWSNAAIWKSKLAHLKKGDQLLIQYPLMSKNLLVGKLLKNLRRRGVDVTVLIHDLESLRYINRQDGGVKQKLRITLEERTVLTNASVVIAHNEAMANYLRQQSYPIAEVRTLGIFDYLLPETFRISEKQPSHHVMIAGNLDANKVGYLKGISSIQGAFFQLFGANYQEVEADNIQYNGSFMPDDLPKELVGGYGLVWDGDSTETCSGMYGDYLRFNNPHKTSLYLACGFPVVIWKQAALAPFIEENNLGVTINSLDDLSKLQEISKDNYDKMVSAVSEMSQKLRHGYFLKKAVNGER